MKLFNYPIPLAQKKWDSAWMLLAHSLDAPASTLQHCQAGQSGGRVFACPVDSGMKGGKGPGEGCSCCSVPRAVH